MSNRPTTVEKLAAKWRDIAPLPLGYETEDATWWLLAIAEELDQVFGGHHEYQVAAKWLRERASEGVGSDDNDSDNDS